MKRKELWNEHGMRVDEEGRVLGDHPEELTAEDEALLDEVEDRLNAERMAPGIGYENRSE